MTWVVTVVFVVFIAAPAIGIRLILDRWERRPKT